MNVIAQKDQIAQILDNLISNAISFAPPDTRVSVIIRPAADQQIECIIADQGPGISSGMEERIFERFYSDRPNALDASDNGHSGLGLSISRQIARMHGGDVTAANRPDGIGAYFTLTLPRQVTHD